MTQQEELVKGLNKLNSDVKILASNLQNSNTIGETIKSLSVLSQIENTINKAIQKVSTSGVIPKQSVIKPSRS